MADVHGVGGPAAGVEEEGFALLHFVEDRVHVAVGEEDPAPQQVVHGVPGDLLHPVQEHLVDLRAAESLWKGQIKGQLIDRKI